MSGNADVARRMVEYIQLTENLINELKEANEKLSDKMEKQASQFGFSKSDVEGTVDNIIRAGFLKEAERQTATKAIMANPASLLAFLNKLASKKRESQSVPRLGKYMASASESSGSEADRLFERVFGGLRSKV